MNIKAFFGVMALVLNLVGYVPYIRDIFRGKVVPHRITWGVWTILTAIVAFNQLKNGGGWSSLFFISTTMVVAVVFVLSIKKGIGSSSPLDKACLVLALILLGYWLTLHDTKVSTYVAVVIDALGAMPTIIKTYKHPETETYIQWALAAVAGMLTFFSVQKVELVLIVYPLYIFTFNGLIVGAKYISEHR